MNNLLLLSGIIGFGPAFIIMWFGMRKYDWPYLKGACFDDRKVFFSLALGMVIGTVLFTIERVTYPTFRQEPTPGEIYFNPMFFTVVFVAGLGALQTLGKYIMLNFPGFQGRPDSQFLGLAMGAGMASTWVVGFAYVAFIARGDEQSFENWLALALLSLNIALIHVSTGTLLGNSSIMREGMHGIPRALVPHMVLNALMFPWFATGVIWYTIAMATPISLIIYWRVYEHQIPACLPDEIKEEIREREIKEKRASGRRRGS